MVGVPKHKPDRLDSAFCRGLSFYGAVFNVEAPKLRVSGSWYYGGFYCGRHSAVFQR